MYWEIWILFHSSTFLSSPLSHIDNHFLKKVFLSISLCEYKQNLNMLLFSLNYLRELSTVIHRDLAHSFFK